MSKLTLGELHRIIQGTDYEFEKTQDDTLYLWKSGTMIQNEGTIWIGQLPSLEELTSAMKHMDDIPVQHIIQFRGPYRWLSNFAGCRINYGDPIPDWSVVKYTCVENAYQSAKSDDPEWREFCRENTPGVVKRASRKIKIHPNWDDMKVNVMKVLLMQKFSQEPYRTLLLETGNIDIIEGNTWGDKFWGVCLETYQGENKLGRLIMDFRS